MATLRSLAETFGASLEATARQLASLDIWPCAFVFWEDGHRKEDQERQNLHLLPGFEDIGRPHSKLRVKSPYAAHSFGHYVPRNKSVPDASLVALCSDTNPITWGIELFVFGRGNEATLLYCENFYAPYTRGSAHCRRIISLLLPVGRKALQIESMGMYQLEAL